MTWQNKLMIKMFMEFEVRKFEQVRSWRKTCCTNYLFIKKFDIKVRQEVVFSWKGEQESALERRG